MIVSLRNLLLIEHFDLLLLLLHQVRRGLLGTNWMRLLGCLLIKSGSELSLLNLPEVSLLAVGMFDALDESCWGVAVDWNDG